MIIKRVYILVIITSILIFCLSCSFQKEVTLIGFAYKNDSITIRQGKQILLNIRVTGSEDKNRLCSFNQKIKALQSPKGIQLNIRLDSSGTNLLDTIVLIQKNSKEPFISFLYPTETNSKRILFLGDETDSNYIKY